MINANEQRVIAAASGTFEYKGKTYRAKDSYISQLRSKLDQEDVDLSGADASAAISQIMANVGTGVAQGYLEEVAGGKSEKEDKSSEEAEKNKKSEKKKTDPADPLENISGKEEKEETSDTAADQNSATPAPAQIVQIYPEAAGKIGIRQEFSENSAAARQTGQAFERFGMMAILVCIVFVIGAAVYLKRIKHRKKMSGGLAGMILVILSVLFIGWGYLFGSEVYSGERWAQVVTESSYINDNYVNVDGGLRKVLSAAGLSGESSAELFEECFNENSVYRDAKAMLSGDPDARKDLMDKKEKRFREIMEEKLPGVPESQRQKLGQILRQDYEKCLEISWTSYLKEHREAGQKRAGILYLAGLLAMAAGVIVLKCRTRYAHRAVRGIAMGCLGGGAGFALSGLLSRMGNVPLVLEPDSYCRLLLAYVQSLCQSGLYFGILLLCTGLIFAIISYFMKTRIE